MSVIIRAEFNKVTKSFGVSTNFYNVYSARKVILLRIVFIELLNEVKSSFSVKPSMKIIFSAEQLCRCNR